MYENYIYFMLPDVGYLTLKHIGEFRCRNGMRFYINRVHLLVCVCVCDEALNCVCRHRTIWLMFLCK